MQNALKVSLGITKRAFTVAVVVATIAWSVAATFAIAPRIASAAVSSGDLVKGSLPAVYYIGSDGKRYVFTNDKAYFTWYTDFSTVKKISDTELAAVTIGGNVTYRPGVKMVKIQSDPKVYAVAHGGVLRWVATEAAAVALYGANWNTKIDDISDAFFVNYTVGSQINSASDYNTTNETNSSSTINADKGLAGAGAINVTLASDNPAGGTLTYTAAGVNLVKVNFAGTGTVSGLTFKRIGAGLSSDWGNVYLYDGDIRLTSGRSVTSSANEVSFSNLNVAVSGSKTLTLVGDLLATNTNAVAGNSHAFELEAATKVLSSVTIGGSFPVVGNNFVLSGSASGSIMAAVGSTVSNPKVGQTGVELASFKLTGGTTEDVSVRRLVINNSGSAQLANLANMQITTGGTVVAQNPIISGSSATFVLAVPYTLGKGTSRTFSIIADISGANRPNVDTIHLYIDQTYDVYATGVTYGLGVAVTNNYTSALANGGTTLTIEGGQITYAQNGPATGDISVGANEVSLLKLAVTAANHVEVRNTALRLTASADIDATGGTNDIASITDIKIRNADTGVVLAGPLDLSSWANTNNGTIFTRAYTDRYEIAAGQTLNLILSADIASAATLAGISLTAQLDARVATDIRNLDSNLDVPATDIVPTSALAGNPQTVRASGLTVGLASSPTSATVTKGSTVSAVGINFTAGSASDVKITQIKLRGMIDADANLTYGNTVATDGGTSTVADIIQSVTIWDGTTQLGVAKSPDSTGDLNFTSLSWTIPAGTTKTLIAKAVVSNNVPYSGASDIFFVDLIGDGTAAVAGVGKTVNVTAQDKDSNTVYGTSAGWSATDYHLQAGDTVTAAATLVSGTLAPIAITAQASGTIQVAIDGDTPTAALLTANTNDNSVTRLKFTSINEGFLVTRMTVENTTAAASRSITSVRLFDKNGTLFCSGALDSNDRLRCANDAGLFTVANDQVITIKVNLDQEGSGTTGANSGDTPVMALYVDADDTTYTDDIKVVGVSSGTALVDTNERDSGHASFATASLKLFDDSATDQYTGGTATYISGNSFVVRKTQPTVATVASSTTLINGEMTVYKFSVTAASNADVALKQFNMNMSRSNVGLGSYRIFENGTALDSTTYEVNATSVGSVVTDPIDLTVAAAMATAITGATINVSFNTERVVAAGTTKTYDIKATISDAAAGDSLTHVLVDDAASMGTNDAGFAMNLGARAKTIGAAGDETLILDVNNGGTLTAASETEVDVDNAWTGGDVTLANAGLVFYDPAVGTDNDGYVYVDTDRDSTYDAGTDAKLTVSNDQAADMTAYNGTTQWLLVWYDAASGTDDDEVVYFDTNRDNTYTAGTDIRLTTVAASYGADTTALNGLVTATYNNFIWSDTSADAHSRATADWTNGFRVKTLPTTAQSLSL